jgi:hypothetical protein
MEDAPSNAVLETKLDALKDAMLVGQQSLREAMLADQLVNHEAHAAIIVQTTKTNGRTTNLEKFKNITIGFIIFLNLFVVPIAVAAIIKYLNV